MAVDGIADKHSREVRNGLCKGRGGTQKQPQEEDAHSHSAHFKAITHFDQHSYSCVGKRGSAEAGAVCLPLERDTGKSDLADVEARRVMGGVSRLRRLVVSDLSADANPWI